MVTSPLLSLLVALVVALTACSGGGPAPATGSDRAGGDAASSAADATDAADEPTASVEVGSSVRPLSDGELAAARQQLVEAADCPVGFDQLVVVEVPYLDFDEVSRRGTVIVNADVADDVASTFEQLHVAGFQIERVDAIDPLPVDDTSRLSSNNTVGFKCRAVRGGTSWSQHAYGHAVDINPVDNPAVRDGQATPPLGADRLDRTLQEPGMIREGDAATSAFDAIGWGWGGRWTSHQDYMHFSLTGD